MAEEIHKEQSNQSVCGTAGQCGHKDPNPRKFTSTMNGILETALLYIAIGLYVIRLTPNQKTPMDKRWQYENATNDIDQATCWFSDGECGIGIPTGERNQLAVIDCDSDAVGRQFYRDNSEIMSETAISIEGPIFG